MAKIKQFLQFIYEKWLSFINPTVEREEEQAVPTQRNQYFT